LLLSPADPFSDPTSTDATTTDATTTDATTTDATTTDAATTDAATGVFRLLQGHLQSEYPGHWYLPLAI
jgi:hypothetical protein